MILLDTNYLIGVLVPESRETALIKYWFRSNQLCTSSIVWYEFLCGPVGTQEISLVESLLCGRIFPFGLEEAEKAASLFNAVGRPRRLRVDSMIAASALFHNAQLATANIRDFNVFTPAGLLLVADKLS